MDMELRGDPWRQKKKARAEKEEPAAGQPAMPPKHRVLITDEARREYDALSANVQGLVDEILQRLGSWPEVSGTRSLFGKGYAPGKFRMKTWDWRVEFQVDDKAGTITVQRIGHRDTFYDEYH